MKFIRKIRDIALLLLYVYLIYSTLSVTPVWSDNLENIFGPLFNKVIDSFIIALGSALLIIFYKNIECKGIMGFLGVIVIFLIYAALIVYLTPTIAEKVHLLEYGLLSYLALRVFSANGGSASGGKDMRSCDVAYLYTIGTVAVIGYIDEFIQKFLPNRFYDINDVILNILSGLLGLILINLLR